MSDSGKNHRPSGHPKNCPCSQLGVIMGDNICWCICHEPGAAKKDFDRSVEKASRDFHKKNPNWKKMAKEAKARAAKLTREIEEAHRATANSTLNFGPGKKRKKKPSKK